MSEELLALLDGQDHLDDHHPVEGASGTEAASIEASEVVVDPPLLLLQLLEMANHSLDVGGCPGPASSSSRRSVAASAPTTRVMARTFEYDRSPGGERFTE